MTSEREHGETDKHGVTENAWRRLRVFTDARIGLGRSGVSIPTAEMLQFQLAHAQARDAVLVPLNLEALIAGLAALRRDFPTQIQSDSIFLRSEAPDRLTYLQRPDLGRQLNEESRARLHQSCPNTQQAFDLAIVIADGLSARAVNENTVPFLRAFLNALVVQETPVTLAPLVLVQQGRVAVGDDVGERLNARAVVVMIGERPGLSSPDSLGLYLTWSPQRGLKDDKRNCISNVRKAGLMFDDAARKLLYLLAEARRLQGSGVVLKDRSDNAPIEGAQPSPSFLLKE